MFLVRYLFIFVLSLLILSNNVFGELSETAEIAGKLQKLDNDIQLAGCQTYLSHGYRYEHMYRIDGVVFDNVVVNRGTDELIEFEMHIAIKAEKDGFILLSPKAWPESDDLVFEIGIGTDNNTRSVVRLKKTRDVVLEVATPGILSKAQYKKFIINISNDVLTINVAGEAPIMRYSDIRLRGVKYFDVSSWDNIDGKFLFDCPPPIIH